MKTVVGVFDTREHAQQAIQDLVAAGVSREGINVLSPNRGNDVLPGFVENEEEMEKGEAVVQDTAAGALFGGFGGALLGVLALGIPGLGPILAAGPIASALVGTVIGAAGGVAIGAIQDRGIPEGDSHLYAEAVKRGGTLVIAHADDQAADQVKNILDKDGAIDIEARAEEFRAGGWTQFDHTNDEPVGVTSSRTRSVETVGTSELPINSDSTDTRGGNRDYADAGASAGMTRGGSRVYPFAK